MAKAKMAKEKQTSQPAPTSKGEERTGIARRERYTPAQWMASPFNVLRRFAEEMDRLSEDFGFGRSWLSQDIGRGFGQAMWSPQVELFERDNQLVVRADLPGLTKDDVDVEITDDGLTIRGERRQESEEKEEGYYRSERSYGTFYRQIPLPEGVRTENANASFRDGVLEITMPAPERELRQGKKLQIK